MNEYGLTEDQGAYVVGTLFEADARTVGMAMMPWCLCMVHHLEEFKKLQDELDTIVGDARLPEFEDMAKVPRVRAVVKEVGDTLEFPSKSS